MLFGLVQPFILWYKAVDGLYDQMTSLPLAANCHHTWIGCGLVQVEMSVTGRAIPANNLLTGNTYIQVNMYIPWRLTASKKTCSAQAENVTIWECAECRWKSRAWTKNTGYNMNFGGFRWLHWSFEFVVLVLMSVDTIARAERIHHARTITQGYLLILYRLSWSVLYRHYVLSTGMKHDSQSFIFHKPTLIYLIFRYSFSSHRGYNISVNPSDS